MKKRYFLQCFLFLAMLFGLSACGSSSDDDGVSSGTVRLALTDAVDHNYAAVVISIKEIRAVPAGEEGKSVGSLPLIVSYQTPLIVDVLDLAYQQQLLGEAVLPAGRYNQLRLVLTANTDPLLPANYIILTDDADAKKIPIDTPSGQQSGLKVVGGFEVQAGESTAVILDFDPARSVVETGVEDKRIFKPTGIRVVQAEDVPCLLWRHYRASRSSRKSASGYRCHRLCLPERSHHTNSNGICQRGGRLISPPFASWRVRAESNGQGLCIFFPAGNAPRHQSAGSGCGNFASASG